MQSACVCACVCDILNVDDKVVISIRHERDGNELIRSHFDAVTHDFPVSIIDYRSMSAKYVFFTYLFVLNAILSKASLSLS